MPTLGPNEDIIHRLRAHARDAQAHFASTPAAHGRPHSLYPPVPPDQVREAEAALGFPLLPLLRDIYTEVGHGELGLGGSLLPLRDRHGYGVVELHHELRKQNYVLPELEGILPPWPERLLPFWAWGCGILSCMDCGQPDAPVYGFDPHLWEQELLFRLSPSLASWLEAGLNGVDLWEELRRKSGQPS